MYYGEDIIITRKGIRISTQALRPIGIEDGSVCWGVVLPRNPEDSDKTKPPHLVISAFHPRDWLSLFRLTIELGSDVGTLAQVTKLLNGVAFNILSTQCALSGYAHATWNITGQALDKKNSEIESGLTHIIEKHFRKDVSAFNAINDKFKIELTNFLTLQMLEKSEDLENKIKEENKNSKGNKNFLYSKLDEFDTLLFKEGIDDENYDNTERLEKYSHILPKSVSCRWLQQLAIYRVYSEAQKFGRITKPKTQTDVRYQSNWENPIRFKYRSEDSLLKPRSLTDEHKYYEIIKECVYIKEIEEQKDFPIRVTGAFNPQEDYVRINLPYKAEKNKRLFINLNYEVDIGIGKENITEIQHFLKNIPYFIRENVNRIKKILKPRPEDSFYQNLEDALTELIENLENKNIDTFKFKLRPGIFKEISKNLKELKEVIFGIEEIHNIKQRISEETKKSQLLDFEEVDARQPFNIEEAKKLFLDIEMLREQAKEEFRVLKKEQKEGTSSIGVLQRIAEKFKERNISIDYVSNSVLNYSQGLEKGKISLIITPAYNSNDLITELKGDLKNFNNVRRNLTFESPTIGHLEAKKIFVSTKFMFWNKLKPAFRTKLTNMVNDYGFIFVTGDRQYTHENSDNENKGQNTEPSITERIRSCDSFLQIFPRLPDIDVEKDKDWLLFELGVARGCGIPYEICIDETMADEYSNKITAGKTFFQFNSYQDTEQILESIKGAVQKLAERCYQR